MLIFEPLRQLFIEALFGDGNITKTPQFERKNEFEDICVDEEDIDCGRFAISILPSDG